MAGLSAILEDLESKLRLVARGLHPKPASLRLGATRPTWMSAIGTNPSHHTFVVTCSGTQTRPLRLPLKADPRVDSVWEKCHNRRKHHLHSNSGRVAGGGFWRPGASIYWSSTSSSLPTTAGTLTVTASAISHGHPLVSSSAFRMGVSHGWKERFFSSSSAMCIDFSSHRRTCTGYRVTCNSNLSKQETELFKEIALFILFSSFVFFTFFTTSHICSIFPFFYIFYI